MTSLIVVADTTPLRYLVVIAREHLLPSLYGRVLIPPAVAEELNHKSTPDVVRKWFAARPSWLEIRQTAESFGLSTEARAGRKCSPQKTRSELWTFAPVPAIHARVSRRNLRHSLAHVSGTGGRLEL